MTLPEHAACSLLLAQFGIRQRMGNRGMILVTIAGLTPDLDSATKLVRDAYFWELHHALGHNLIAISLFSLILVAVGRQAFHIRQSGLLFAWCFVAAAVHCLTDALYWWGVQPFWPFSRYEVRFDILQYLDVFVLLFWLIAAFLVLKRPHPERTAAMALTLFTAYVGLRSYLPPPTGLLKSLMGNWALEVLQDSPILNWW